MSAFLHHLWAGPMAHRLCWTLVHSLWQGLVVSTALALVQWGMRSASATARHAVACVSLAIFGLCPVITFEELGDPSPAAIPAVVPDDAPSAASPAMLPVQSTHGNVTRAPKAISTSEPAHFGFRISWEKWVVAGWLAGVWLLIVKHALGWLMLQRLRRSGTLPLDAEWKRMVERLGRLMKLRRDVGVHWSSRVNVPIAFGWWKPLILLPLGLATGMSPVQIEMILAHEMAHLRRSDYVINLVQSVVEMMLFYHPATWWMARQIRREREHACDDLAVRVVRDSRAYARALVALAELKQDEVPAFALAAGGSRQGLYARVERLLRPRTVVAQPRMLPGMIAALALILAATLPLGRHRAHAQAPKSNPNAEFVRGTIFDRNGVALAITDNPDRQIVFDLDEILKAWSADHGDQLPTYQRGYLAKGDDPSKGQHHEMPMPDAVKMFEDAILPKLEEHHLAEAFNAQLFRERGRWMSKGDGRWRPNVPGVLVTYRRSMSEEDWKRADQIKAQIPGMKTRVLHFRHYPYGALAAHLLGYVREENAVEMQLEEKVGAAGAELTWERTLAPRVVNSKRVRSGDDVYLTLDARYQMIAEQTMRAAGVGRGAAVLMEVDSGSVLAMASLPSYEPADFVPSITKEKLGAYLEDKTYPMINRAVGAYAPGAAFLPVTGLAAVMSGKGDPIYECTGAMDIGAHTFHCWTQPPGHGKQPMEGALETSCNVYFYQLGIATGIDAMESTAKLLGLGTKTGVGLYNEQAGFIPGSEWYEKKESRKWSNAMSANTAIGQGYVLTTPLQMANVMSTLANGGTVWRPRVVERIVSKVEGRADVSPKIRSADLREHGLNGEGLKLIQNGLFATVHGEHGSGRKASSDTISIAGRTGTAQALRENGEKDDHAWFTCYAPVEHPRWALAVMVEGGKSGGGVAAPIARRILEQVAAVDEGSLKVELKPLAPAKGHFNQIEQVNEDP